MSRCTLSGPGCHKSSDKASDEYKDHGHLVKGRLFLILYFDDVLLFPAESSVRWMGAKDLRHLDAQDQAFTFIPH